MKPQPRARNNLRQFLLSLQSKAFTLPLAQLQLQGNHKSWNHTCVYANNNSSAAIMKSKDENQLSSPSSLCKLNLPVKALTTTVIIILLLVTTVKKWKNVGID